MKKQGVKIIDTQWGHKLRNGEFAPQIELYVNPMIEQLNKEGKTVTNVSCSQTGGFIDMYITLLYEYEE